MPTSPTPVPRRQYTASGVPGPSSSNPHQVRITGGYVASRRGTPLDDFAMNVDRPSGSPFMERREETIFAKTDEFIAAQYANLPIEAIDTLRKANFYRESFHGDLDVTTGFAVVASVKNCFVWQYSQALTGTPTCYIFPCPVDTVFGTAPFNALVPSGTTREPGLLLLSPSGDLRFYESVTDGLGGAKHYKSDQLDLSAHEAVTAFVRSDPQTYLMSTSQGRLFRLTLSPSGGRQHLISRPFGRPQTSSLSRFLPISWSSSGSVMPTETEAARAVALGERIGGSREAWALLETRIQRWQLLDEGWEEQLLDEEILGLCSEGIRDAFPSAPAQTADLVLELLDLAVVGTDQLIILASYTGPQEDASMDGAHPRTIYAVLYLLFTGTSFRISHVTGVPYQSTSSSGAPMHPRFKVLANGALVVIQFGDAVTFCARDSGYLDRLELKSAQDRTLGVGVSEAEGEVLVLTSAMMVKTSLDTDKIADFNAETGRAKVIKSIMTQAILYGSNPQNPLHFSFPPEVDEESLMLGAEQLSSAVLKSDVELVKPNHDLSAHMAVRKARLNFLIEFINDNGALGKISPRTRQHLAADAEKLYAASQLWLRHSEKLANNFDANVLNDAIYAYMSDYDGQQHDDFVRAFFRLHVDNLEGLEIYVKRIVVPDDGQPQRLDLVPEANDILLTIFGSARRYRETNCDIYGLRELVNAPWTSRPKIVNDISVLFEMTVVMVAAPADLDVAGRGGKDYPLRQLPELAAWLFESMQERLQWVTSPYAPEKYAKDAQSVDERFSQMRAQILDELRRNGHLERAFALAEQYRDYRNLAALCNEEPVWPPRDSRHADRMKTYLDTFKQEFANELFHWYVQRGELRCLFDHEDARGNYIQKYFEQFSYTKLAWIHQLGQKQYDVVEARLLSESAKAKTLVEQQLMLSLGKLCVLAQENNVATQQQDLDEFHHRLDLVSVQELLLENFTLSLNPKVKLSLEARIDAVTREKAARLDQQPAFSMVFQAHIKQLLRGKVLSPEDLVDVLALKDNISEEDRDDYILALRILARSQESIPSARITSAQRSVWRRIYLHDDWNAIRQTANVSDYELSNRFRQTALYHALRAAHRNVGLKILSPAESVGIPSATELEARWHGQTPDQIEAIEDAHREESERLTKLKLEDVIDRVGELALHDPVWT